MEHFPEFKAPTCEEQIDVLYDFHSQQRSALEDSDMLEKALDLLVHPTDTDLFHVSLNRTSMRLDNGEDMHIVNIRISERKIAPNGKEYTYPQYVAVAKTYKGIIYPCTEFTSDEAKWAVDMMDDLETLRGIEVLPNLDESLNYIRDPNVPMRPNNLY